MRMNHRDDRIRDYFYGIKTKFHPHSFDIPFSAFTVYKIGAPSLPDSCMPADMKVDDHMTKVVQVETSKKYILAILNVMFNNSYTMNPRAAHKTHYSSSIPK